MSQMSVAYALNKDGTSAEVKLRKDDLSSESVFCVVDESTKSIYVWTGKKANVRMRFVGATAAQRIRSEYGNNYRVRPLDEGEEPPGFFESL